MQFPEMAFSIEKVTVVARSRELKATWASEIEEFHHEIDEQFVEDITREIVFGITNFNWTQFHRATRKERLQILGLK